MIGRWKQVVMYDNLSDVLNTADGPKNGISEAPSDLEQRLFWLNATELWAAKTLTSALEGAATAYKLQVSELLDEFAPPSEMSATAMATTLMEGEDGVITPMLFELLRLQREGATFPRCFGRFG